MDRHPTKFDNMMKHGAWILLLVVYLSRIILADPHHPYTVSANTNVASEHENNEYWDKLGLDELMMNIDKFKQLNTNIAKNIILFIGDGMSLPTLTASRIYKAQMNNSVEGTNVNGEETLLTLEKFPHVGLSKTYSVDRQTPDSASTASAIYSGVKTNYYTFGFDNSIKMGNSTSQKSATRVETIMQWAQDAGKDTGFVTSARVSHATPGALYAHIADRNWECDRKTPDGVWS